MKLLKKILLVWLLLINVACAERTRPTPKAAGIPAGISAEHFVDTSQYAMHVHFTGFNGDTAKAFTNLRTQLDRILNGPEFRNGTITSVKINFFGPTDSTHTVYSKNASVSVLPASVEKMFTSSSTIWALGSHYAFTTKLDLAPNGHVDGNKIIGNIYLRPSGDPTLRSSDLDLLAQQLRNQGITAIQGDVISDLGADDILTPEAKKYMTDHHLETVSVKDSLMDTPQVSDNGIASTQPPPTSAPDEEEDAADPGVLSSFPNFAIDRNVVSVSVSGGAGKGSPLNIKVFPPLGSVVLDNQGSTSAAAVIHSRTVGRGRHKRTITTRTPTITTLRVSSEGGPTDSQQVIHIAGLLPARVQRTYTFPITNVPLAVAALLKWRLTQDGIQVSGAPRVAKAPVGQKFKILASKETKLMDLLQQMNKRSDNYLAETMFRKLSTIASVAATAPDERARTLMRSWLQVCNVDGSQCTFIDGSGLSKSNRTTANTVTDLLTSIKRQNLFELFTQTLSVAGYDGTLRHRMMGTPAQYNAHGKTGTLNGVTALAGYVITGDGQLASYFITMQNYHNGPYAYRKDQDRIVETLASFRYNDYLSEATIPPIKDSASRRR